MRWRGDSGWSIVVERDARHEQLSTNNYSPIIYLLRNTVNRLRNHVRFFQSRRVPELDHLSAGRCGAGDCGAAADGRAGQANFAARDGGRVLSDTAHAVWAAWADIQIGHGHDAEPVLAAVDSDVRHSLPDGSRRYQLSARGADGVCKSVGNGRELADLEAPEGLLRAVSLARNGDARRVLCARFLPVLRVLGSDAAADVLPNRHLGRAAERIRGHQILLVHFARQRTDADRHFDAVLQQRSAEAADHSINRDRRCQLAIR